MMLVLLFISAPSFVIQGEPAADSAPNPAGAKGARGADGNSTPLVCAAPSGGIPSIDRELVVSHSAFQPIGATGNATWSSDFNLISRVSNAEPSVMVAPLSLPNGAIVRGLKCDVHDEDATAALSVTVWTSATPSTTNTCASNLAVLSSDALAPVVQLLDTGCDLAVDNDVESASFRVFHLVATMLTPTTGFSKVALFSCRVRYSITQLGR